LGFPVMMQVHPSWQTLLTTEVCMNMFLIKVYRPLLVERRISILRCWRNCYARDGLECGKHWDESLPLGTDNFDPNYLNIFWLNFSLGAIFLLFGLFWKVLSPVDKSFLGCSLMVLQWKIEKKTLMKPSQLSTSECLSIIHAIWFVCHNVCMSQ
jgi:hypothetical protein